MTTRRAARPEADIWHYANEATRYDRTRSNSPSSFDIFAGRPDIADHRSGRELTGLPKPLLTAKSLKPHVWSLNHHRASLPSSRTPAVPFLHAAIRSSLSAPRATILSASSRMAAAAPSPHPMARASRRRAPHPSSGSPASPWDGSARSPRSATEAVDEVRAVHLGAHSGRMHMVS